MFLYLFVTSYIVSFNLVFVNFVNLITFLFCFYFCFVISMYYYNCYFMLCISKIPTKSYIQTNSNWKSNNTYYFSPSYEKNGVKSWVSPESEHHKEFRVMGKTVIRKPASTVFSFLQDTKSRVVWDKVKISYHPRFVLLTFIDTDTEWT